MNDEDLQEFMDTVYEFMGIVYDMLFFRCIKDAMRWATETYERAGFFPSYGLFLKEVLDCYKENIKDRDMDKAYQHLIEDVLVPDRFLP